MNVDARSARPWVGASPGLLAVLAVALVLTLAGARDARAAATQRYPAAAGRVAQLTPAAHAKSAHLGARTRTRAAMPAHLGRSAARASAATRRGALHDGMRTLWEQHVAWTRLAIASFAAASPDLVVTEQRLLRNQVDIGNAIKPFYGRAAGDRLTSLLQEHIRGAVALLQAAKGGDAAKVARAKSAWYANGRSIADFLAAANPRHWSRRELRAMMKTHLDQTLREAVDQLTGHFAAAVREYDAIERHILGMADLLSNGIIRQFPRRWR